MLADLNETVFWSLNGHPSAFGDLVMAGFTFTGLAFSSAVIALLAMYLYKGLNRRNIILLAVSLAMSGMIVHAVKDSFIADRPLAYFAEKRPPLNARVHAPFERHSHRTFPSGHSQSAFSVATLIILLFRRHAWLWLTWAGMVAVSRVYLGMHFPLDVLAGALVGALISFLTVKGAHLLKEGGVQEKEWM